MCEQINKFWNVNMMLGSRKELTKIMDDRKRNKTKENENTKQKADEGQTFHESSVPVNQFYHLLPQCVQPHSFFLFFFFKNLSYHPVMAGPILYTNWIISIYIK